MVLAVRDTREVLRGFGEAYLALEYPASTYRDVRLDIVGDSKRVCRGLKRRGLLTSGALDFVDEPWVGAFLLRSSPRGDQYHHRGSDRQGKRRSQCQGAWVRHTSSLRKHRQSTF